ncbi:MAG: hypothetical protein IPG21_11075 [Saprospiraceae bacterium]|nr:hypothetical protein [Candidatus Vicinibacter affinis]
MKIESKWILFKSKKGIDKTFFAASNDEMRQSMRGINLNIDFKPCDLRSYRCS